MNVRPTGRVESMARACALAWMSTGTLLAQEPPVDVPDPRLLLEESRAACLAARTVRYLGRFEEFGERHAAGVTVAQVVLSRGDEVIDAGVRFRVAGERWFRERTSPSTFDAAFDGAIFRRRDAARLTVVERRFEDLSAGASAWSIAAGHLGAGGNGVVLWDLVNANPLRRSLESESLEYEGRASVLGVLCDVVVIPGEERHASTRVFLGVHDHFPRKVEEILVMLTDRISGSLLTLSNLRVDEDLPDDAFHVAVPEDHELKLYAPREVKETLVAVGTSAPAFALRDPAGVVHSLADLRGRTVILDFWGTWCGPCIRKLPEIQEVHARNRDRPVTVIGISCHEAPNARPAEVMARYGCGFGLLLDGDAVAAAYGVAAFPSVVVVAPDGTVAFRRRGGASVEELQAAVDAVTAEAPR